MKPKTRTEFLDAARRQYEIAQFHAKALDALLRTSPPAEAGGLPPIAVQAYFEGVLSAFASGLDKCACALTENPGGSWRALCGRENTLGKLAKTWTTALHPDVTKQIASVDMVLTLRNRATHRFTTKTPTKPGWSVEVVRGRRAGDPGVAIELGALVSFVFDRWKEVDASLKGTLAGAGWSRPLFAT